MAANDDEMMVFPDDPEGPSGHVSPVRQVENEWCFTMMRADGAPLAVFYFPSIEEANKYAGVLEELIGHAKVITKPAKDDVGWIAPQFVR